MIATLIFSRRAMWKFKTYRSLEPHRELIKRKHYEKRDKKHYNDR